MLFLLMNPKASSRNQPAAGSRKPATDCLSLYIQRLLPAYWYLGAFLTLTARTEILRLQLRMTMRAGREARNVGSFLRKELPDRAEDRSVFWLIELTLLSSIAYGDTSFLWKGALALSHAVVVTQQKRT